MNLPYTKLIRDGNHFIGFAEGEWQGRWLLIDGPWFDYLEELSQSYHGRVWSVQMYYSAMLPGWVPPDICNDPIAYEIDQHIVTWERVKWQPWAKFPTKPWHNQDGSLYHRWYEMVSFYTSYYPFENYNQDRSLHQRWYEMASARKKIGWWLPREGYQVPAYINHLEFVDDYFLAKSMPGTSTALAHSQRGVLYDRL